MTLGEKIKEARIKRGLTQSELCEGGITRNMLSRIENGTALPSLDTLGFIAERLGIPTGYLLSDDFDVQLYLFDKDMKIIRTLFGEKRYKECIDRCNTLYLKNDEVYYVLAYSHFNVGLDYFAGGSMQSAQRSFRLSLECCEGTVYDTLRIRSASMLYLAVCDNASLPLLNFDSDTYVKQAIEASDFEFFKYLTQDTEYSFKNERYAAHISAKRLIKERKYEEAARILSSLEETRRNYPPNAYFMLLVYTDLEVCYKNLIDFERAYKYSSKRISLLGGFST